MMAERDPYSVLGVSKGSTDAEIKRAFRKKARQFHPDRNPDNDAAEAKFKEVQSAYEKIGSAEARRQYDQQQQMANMFGGQMGGNPFGGMGGGGFEDILGQMFQGGRGAQFGGRAGNPFGGQPRRQSSPKARGADIKVGLEISLEEAEQGGSFSFTFKRLKPNQSGTMEAKSVTLKTTLKPGVTHGTTKRMKGQGHDHPEGEAGDVILTIRVNPGEGRYWDGEVLIQEVATSFSTLALGGKVKVTLPSGKEGMLTVPAKTKIGDRRRMAKAGFMDADLDLEFVLDELEEFTAEQLELIEKMRNVGL